MSYREFAAADWYCRHGRDRLAGQSASAANA
jgi:hypothetical protein